MDTDQRIKVDLSKEPMWPGGGALHTIITPDGNKAYLSVMSSDKDPATFLALRINKLDWQNNTADVKITKVMRAAEPGEQPSRLVPTQTDPNQPVTDLWKPGNQQLHGPTIHPSGKFVYFTQWTDNKIRVIDVDKDELAAVDPIRYGTRTRQIHGVFFNPSGDLAMATGYYYDINEVTLYKVDKQTGNLTIDKVVPLTISENDKQYAAFTHFVWWHEIYATRDGRYVYAQSWASGHLVKIDGATDKVISVVSAGDAGWHMPHGNFVQGAIR